MRRCNAFPGIYLLKDELTAPMIVTIAEVQREEFISQSDGRHVKPVLSFNECKPLILNRVNWATIAKAYGDDSDQWIDKKIELYYDPTVMYAGRLTGGIRARIPTPSQISSQPALAPRLTF